MVAKPTLSPIDIKSNYARREKVEIEKSIGLYKCFKRPLVALIENRESIVLCDPLSLNRIMVF